MTFDEISQIMASSDRSEWQTAATRPNGARQVSAYKHDVLLRVEVSYVEDGVHNDNFKEEWANNFPDRSASAYYADLYYGPTYLDSYILVSVDGGRALLPLPESAKSLHVKA